MSETTRRAFDRLAGTLDYPIFVVTVATGDEHSGCLIGFSTQCSINPVRFLACISKVNHTFGVAERCDVFVVHVLHESDLPIARVFGEETGDAVDKFAEVDWSPGPNGVPVLRGCDWFAGRVVDKIDGGDHVGYVLEVLDEGDASRADEPQLGFRAVQDLDPGHPA